MCNLLAVAASNNLVESISSLFSNGSSASGPCCLLWFSFAEVNVASFQLYILHKPSYPLQQPLGPSGSSPLWCFTATQLQASRLGRKTDHITFYFCLFIIPAIVFHHIKFNEGICFSLLLNCTNVFHTVCRSVCVQLNSNNKNVITFSRFSVCRCFLCPPWSWMTEGGSNKYWVASESANIINLLAEREKRAVAACEEPVNISLCGGQLQSLWIYQLSVLHKVLIWWKKDMRENRLYVLLYIYSFSFPNQTEKVKIS